MTSTEWLAVCRQSYADLMAAMGLSEAEVAAELAQNVLARPS